MPEEIDKELEAINADIEKAKGALVSKGTEELIQKAKEEARKEAEKEFLVNQRIKEIETQKAELQKKLDPYIQPDRYACWAEDPPDG